MSYCVGSDMSCKDMILDSVSVANLDEVNLSDIVVSGVIFPKFTSLVLCLQAPGDGFTDPSLSHPMSRKKLERSLTLKTMSRALLCDTDNSLPFH